MGVKKMSKIQIEIDEEHSVQETLEEVLRLVKQGFTSGHNPNWSID